MIGSRSTNASLATSTVGRRRAELGAPRAQRAGAELLAGSPRAPRRCGPSAASRPSAAPAMSLRSFASALCSLRISISSSLRSERSRMFRIASACMSVSLKRCDQPRLRFILLADDADHLVEVQIDQQIAVEDLDAPLDRRQPMARAAHQHLVAVIEPGAQHLAAATSPAACASHPARSCSAESAPPARWRGTASPSALRARRRASSVPARGAPVSVLSSRTSPSSGSFFSSISWAICSISLRLLHLIGDFGDDDLPGAVLALLDRPSGAHAEAAAAGLVGRQDRRRVLHQHAAGREIRARHVAQQIGRRRLRDGGSGGSRRRRPRRRCAAGWRSPCRPRCRPRRWRAGSGNAPGSTTGSLSSPS